MVKADYSDKALVIEILTHSFKDNKSVNYIIKQDAWKERRIRQLMSYSFELCHRYGKVFLADNKTGCVLVILPDKKRTTLYSIYLDLKLIFSCMGLLNVGKTVARESKIKSLQPASDIYYLWFIGVDPDAQNKGTGSALLQELMVDAAAMERIVCLETSTVKNIPWYEKFGFSIYNQLDLGYKLFFLKN